MAFAVPGLGDLRFHLAASGVGDVHLRVDAPGDDGTASASAHDALPAATWPYPLDPRVSMEALRAPAQAERARARRLEDALANAAAAAARVTDAYVFDEGGTIVEPSAPETEVAPTLPPLSPRFLVAGDAARGGEARDVEATRSETDAIDASETVGWRETVRRVDRRRRGAPADFVRGAATQQPFTPGGAGWEAAARASARRRDAEARRAGAYPQRWRRSRTARGGWDPATDPARPTRGVAGDAAPLVVADLWLKRRRSLAQANGEGRVASAEGCRAVAAIEGSMVSPRREQNASCQSSREARVGCVGPRATARMVRCRCENRRFWASGFLFRAI